ncbi:hypothetical protein ACEPPN_005732 [Leptodophora sp. 'Broadleaf-Isolate-01']
MAGVIDLTRELAKVRLLLQSDYEKVEKDPKRDFWDGMYQRAAKAQGQQDLAWASFMEGFKEIEKDEIISLYTNNTLEEFTAAWRKFEVTGSSELVEINKEIASNRPDNLGQVEVIKLRRPLMAESAHYEVISENAELSSLYAKELSFAYAVQRFYNAWLADPSMYVEGQDTKGILKELGAINDRLTVIQSKAMQIKKDPEIAVKGFASISIPKLGSLLEQIPRQPDEPVEEDDAEHLDDEEESTAPTMVTSEAFQDMGGANGLLHKYLMSAAVGNGWEAAKNTLLILEQSFIESNVTQLKSEPNYQQAESAEVEARENRDLAMSYKTQIITILNQVLKQRLEEKKDSQDTAMDGTELDTDDIMDLDDFKFIIDSIIECQNTYKEYLVTPMNPALIRKVKVFHNDAILFVKARGFPLSFADAIAQRSDRLSAEAGSSLDGQCEAILNSVQPHLYDYLQSVFKGAPNSTAKAHIDNADLELKKLDRNRTDLSPSAIENMQQELQELHGYELECRRHVGDRSCVDKLVAFQNTLVEKYQVNPIIGNTLSRDFFQNENYKKPIVEASGTGPANPQDDIDRILGPIWGHHGALSKYLYTGATRRSEHTVAWGMIEAAQKELVNLFTSMGQPVDPTYDLNPDRLGRMANATRNLCDLEQEHIHEHDAGDLDAYTTLVTACTNAAKLETHPAYGAAISGEIPFAAKKRYMDTLSATGHESHIKKEKSDGKLLVSKAPEPGIKIEMSLSSGDSPSIVTDVVDNVRIEKRIIARRQIGGLQTRGVQLLLQYVIPGASRESFDLVPGSMYPTADEGYVGTGNTAVFRPANAADLKGKSWGSLELAAVCYHRRLTDKTYKKPATVYLYMVQKIDGQFAWQNWVSLGVMTARYKDKVIVQRDEFIKLSLQAAPSKKRVRPVKKIRKEKSPYESDSDDSVASSVGDFVVKDCPMTKEEEEKEEAEHRQLDAKEMEELALDLEAQAIQARSGYVKVSNRLVHRTK